MKKTIFTARFLLILSNFSMAKPCAASTTEEDAISVMQSFLDAVKEKALLKPLYY